MAPKQAPPVQWAEIDRLTREGLLALTQGDTKECVMLRDQIESAELTQVDYTGAGFFVDLSIPTSVAALERNGVVCDVHVRRSSADSPLGLLLFVEAGYAKSLECFAYGDWPRDLSGYLCGFVRWERTGPTGARAIDSEERDIASMWSGFDE